MPPRRVICNCALLVLAACTQPTRPVAIKQFSRDEQEQIAAERNVIADSAGDHPLFDQTGRRVEFTMTPAVFDDWERLRRELRGD